MDPSLGRIADVPVNGHVDNFDSQRAGEAPDPADNVSVDHVEAEFWDACWTLEEEWHPGEHGVVVLL